MTDNDHRIPVTAFGITRFLVALEVILILASVGGQLIFYITGHNSVYGLIDLFNVDFEGNAPTFFSAALLLFSSLLFCIIAIFKNKAHAPYRIHWAILALVFMYLAFDEASFIHELFWRPTAEILGGAANDTLIAVWVIPGIVFTLVFAVTFVKFWLQLKSRTRLLFLVSAAVYIGGAIGMEIVSSLYLELRQVLIHQEMQPQTFIYYMLANIEEAMEMTGIIILIYSLLDYIGTNYGEIRFQLRKIS